jgi:hypothetical protein
MADRDSPIAVNSEKQLFIDEKFIAESSGVTLTMNPPQQMSEPMLVVDRPWEGFIGAYNTVLKEDGRFRLWYDVILPEGSSEIFRGIAYAESDDGIHWTKLNQNLIEFQGSKENNLVAPRLPDAPRGEMEGATVFIDTNPACPPEERYKLWTKMQRIPPEDIQLGKTGGLVAMYSEDGIYWQVYDKRVDTAHCDTQNVPFWDDRLQKYVGYVRSRTETEGYQGRSVGRVESDDFQDWSETEIVFQASPEDFRAPVPPGCRDRIGSYVDVYTNGCMKYPFAQDAYLMMPSFLYHWDCKDIPNERQINFPDTCDVRLLTSRDGINWCYAGGRKPFLRLGAWGSLSSRMIYAAPGVVRVGDDLWHYYKGSNFDHSSQPDPKATAKGSGLFRAVSRLDGFISADTPYEGGALTTPPLIFKGDQLTLNLDTSAGGILRAEIQSANGKPIEGYTLTDSDDHNGNSVSIPVRFQGKSDVSGLAGVPIRLHLQMYDCKLYAFQFTV